MGSNQINQQVERVRNADWKLIAAVGAVVAALVFTLAWQLWKPKPAPPETPAPEIQQADRSKVLERKPDADANPPMQIPKGAKVERLVSVTVKSKTTEPLNSGLPEKLKQEHDRPQSAAGSSSTHQVGQTPTASTIDCPPVTVDLALVKMPDDTRRVVSSSQDGEILSGLDVPVATAEPTPAPKVWAVGAVADPFKRTVGGFVDRDFGWLRAGIQINQRNEGELPTQGWVKIGIRF